MSKIRERRVLMELKRLNKEKESGELPAGWEVCPKSDEDLYLWKAVIPGARDTPYEHGLFELEIKIGEKYPMKHPECKFVTPIYHPNVSLSDGCICVDILGSAWSPANSIKTLLISLQLLMQDPEPDDPMEGEIANLYKTDRAVFDKNCIEHIKTNGIINPHMPVAEEETKTEEPEAEKPAVEKVAETSTPEIAEAAPELIENVTTSGVTTAATPEETTTTTTEPVQQSPPIARTSSIQRSPSNQGSTAPPAISRRQSSVLEMLEQHSSEIEENIQVLSIEECRAEVLEIPVATATAELDIDTNTSEVAAN